MYQYLVNQVVGKSSLINKLIGFEVAIVSAKPQTTRFNIKGIRTTDKSQIIFIDTPGVHNPKNKLNKHMMRGVNIARKNVDIIIYLVDAKKPALDDLSKSILEEIVKSKQKVILCINKIDAIKKERILEIIDKYNNYITTINGSFLSIIPISVYLEEGLDILIKKIEENLPQGNYLFDQDDITNISEKDMVSEIIRGKALNYLNEEIPHGINVTIEKMKSHETENGNMVYNIESEIICKKASHKPIIIGKNKEMLEKIIGSSKKEISKLLNARINLKIWVKVRPNWDNSEVFLRNIIDKIK